MYFQYLCALVLLLMTAAPLRPAEAASFNWNWPKEEQTLKNSQRDFANGNALPKLEAGEMVPEFDVDAWAKAFNFPPFPMMSLNRRWRLLHKNYDKNMKQLQLQQTWLDQEPPSPPDDEHQLTERLADAKPKRIPNKYQGNLYRPSISAGAMTNLGDFFNQLKANVRFAEHSQQLNEAESQLLEGLHPHPLEQDDSRTVEKNEYDGRQQQPPQQLPERKTSKLLQSVRSYRPSQKIRSLVSRNPNGYRGAQFIDPSYMWLGLGK